MYTATYYRQVCRALLAHVARLEAQGRADRFGHGKNYGCYWYSVEEGAIRAPRGLRYNPQCWWTLHELAFRWRFYMPGIGYSVLKSRTAAARRALCLSRARRANDPRVAIADAYAATSGTARKSYRRRHHKALSEVGAFAPMNQILAY